MFQLMLLGIIVIGAALAWIYFNRSAKKKTTVKKEDGGKVIYLFDKDKAKAGENTTNNGTESTEGAETAGDEANAGGKKPGRNDESGEDNKNE